MIHKLLKLFVALLFFQVLLPARPVLADTGPKPEMSFEFEQGTTKPVTIVSGILYECEKADCSDASPLQELGPQRFTCEANSCHAMSYGFGPYHRLEIEFSDGVTRKSNIFETAGFDSKYMVTVRPDDLLVEAQFRLSPSPYAVTRAIVYVCAAVGIVLAAGLIAFLVRRSRKN